MSRSFELLRPEKDRDGRTKRKKEKAERGAEGREGRRKRWRRRWRRERERERGRLIYKRKIKRGSAVRGSRSSVAPTLPDTHYVCALAFRFLHRATVQMDNHGTIVIHQIPSPPIVASFPRG